MALTSADRRWLLLLVLLGAAALWVGWIGFMASDDALYFAGAERWLTQPPFAGSDHWSTRFPLTLTFAGALALFGTGYVAFAVTSVLLYVALVAITGMFAARVGGHRAGWIAALLTATLPVVVSHASTVSVDLLEASALLVGAMLLGGADDDRAGMRRGMGAGLAFGVAILCRETSVLPLVALVPLFLLGRPVPRRVLLASGVGLALVLGGEALFQWAMTGDPLHRYALAFHHDEHIDRAANHEGNFLLHPAIDPVLVLLVNDDFGVLFWVLGFALWKGTARAISGSGRGRLIVVSAMAVTSFLLVAVLVHKLVLNPRYFMLPALVAVIVVAVWLDRAAVRVRMMVLGAIVASNLLLLSVGNAHPRWEMGALLFAAKAYPGEPVYAKVENVRRADLPIRFERLTNVRVPPAPSGSLLIVPEDKQASGAVIERYPSPPTRLGILLRALGLEPLVPEPIARRMFRPSPPVVLLRTPER